MKCPKCNLYCPPGTKQCSCGYVFSFAETQGGKKDFMKKGPLWEFNAENVNKLCGYILLVVIVFFVASFFFKDRLPPADNAVSEVFKEPVQKQEALPVPFDITYEGITYHIKPLFNYELYGMVVSYHHSESFSDFYHKQAKDFLNIKDLCVIWGKNILDEGYLDMKFSNRDFTCYYRYPTREVGARFHENYLSNNHLLTENEIIREKIEKVGVGDQIYLKGYLSEYSHKNGSYKRGTSTTRTDRGNGACETIYVDDFKILSRANIFWRSVNTFSKYLIILLVVGFFVSLHYSVKKD